MILISLVVATLNRSTELVRLFESLQQSTVQNFEVIVIDQNSDNRLDVIIAKYSNIFTIKHIRLSAKNACIARNAGVAHSVGTWVTFPDDDCCYKPDTLELLLNLASQRAGTDMLLGLVIDFDGRPLTKHKVAQAPVSLYNMNGKVSEAAIFCKRTTFNDIKGFDENFGPGSANYSAEGYELIARTLKAGHKVYFDSAIKLLHPHKTLVKDAAAFKIGYDRTYGVGSMMAKHFGLWSVYYLTMYLLKYLAKMVLIRNAVKRQYATHCFKALCNGLLNRPAYA